MEKLRRQLQKEERRIAKAEVKAFKDKMEHSANASRTDVLALGNIIQKRKRSGSGEFGNACGDDAVLAKPRPQEAASIVPDPLTPTSQPGLTDEERVAPSKSIDADSAPDQVTFSTGQKDDEPSSYMDPSVHDSILSQSDSSSDSSSTSSSGSSSDGDSDDEAPDETSTQQDRPERAVVSEHAKPKQVCRAFLHKGSCKRGSSCKYLHELPERGSRGAGSQGVKRAERKKERVGLYQRVSRHVQRQIFAIERVLTKCSCSW